MKKKIQSERIGNLELIYTEFEGTDVVQLEVIQHAFRNGDHIWINITKDKFPRIIEILQEFVR